MNVNTKTQTKNPRENKLRETETFCEMSVKSKL